LRGGGAVLAITEKKMGEFEDAAKRLSAAQQKEAMKRLLDQVDGAEAGIVRQKLAEPNKPLSEAQQKVFDNQILPSMVEKCSQHSSCKGFTLPGDEFCESCAIRFG